MELIPEQKLGHWRLHRTQDGPLRLGVLGASRIVHSAILQAPHDGYVVRALAARELERAQRFIAGTKIEQAYGSYEALLADKTIDAVYVALPASEHAWATDAALAAGKHVLCEKPFALSVEQAQTSVALAQSHQRLLMEAHHWRYHPLVPTVEAWLRELKDVKRIETHFVAGLNNPTDIRLNPALGPGVAMDFGCYNLQWSSWVAETLGYPAEGRALSCVMQGAGELAQGIGAAHPASPRHYVDPHVDLALQAQLAFGELIAELRCDMRDGLPFSAAILVAARDATLCFMNPLGLQGSYVELRDVHGRAIRRSDAPAHPSTYSAQLQVFYDALVSGTPPATSGENIIRTQRMLDGLYASAGWLGRAELRALAHKRKSAP